MLLRLYKQRLVSYYHISQKKKRKEEQVSCEASQPSKEFSDNEKESKAKKKETARPKIRNFKRVKKKMKKQSDDTNS